MSDGFQIRAFDFLAAPVIDHQASGNGSQKGARGFELQAFGSLQQPHKSILGQVCGIGGIAQSGTEPPVEPSVMAAVKRLYCKLGRGHERDCSDVTNDN
ncbi:hypothetical protein D3C85_1551120 [compost metagenome]